jgi:hypothetical protein
MLQNGDDWPSTVAILLSRRTPFMSPAMSRVAPRDAALLRSTRIACQRHCMHLKLLWVLRVFKCSAPTSQETLYISSTKPNQSTLFTETVVVHCKIHLEHTNTLWSESRVFKTTAGGTHSDHRTSDGVAYHELITVKRHWTVQFVRCDCSSRGALLIHPHDLGLTHSTGVRDLKWGHLHSQEQTFDSRQRNSVDI